MHGVYAVVKKSAKDGMESTSWYYKPTEYYSIYDKVMELTGNNHEVAANAASWCELATIGEVYEFPEGEIEILDMD